MPYFWLPEEGLLDRDRKEGGHYRTWRDAGLLETTPGKAINFRAIIKRLAEIASAYDLVCVAYDRAFIKSSPPAAKRRVYACRSRSMARGSFR